MSTFYFAWTPPNTPWSTALQRYAENIISFSIEHNEGDIPTLTMIIKNPKIGLLNPGRLYWAWLAWQGDNAVVHPLFYGRLVGIPTDTLGEAISLKFIARPQDYIRQKQKLAETLKVAPGYDRVFAPANKLDDPDVILEGYSVMYHVDRLTNAVSVSDILIGEDGTLIYGAASATYASLKIHLNQPPLNAVAVQATANWDQRYRGQFDVIYGQMSTFTGEAFISDWPTTGKSLGGGYRAAVGWAANADGILAMASALGTVSGSYSWQNLSKPVLGHQTGDTMSISISYSHNVLQDTLEASGGIKTIVWQRNQIGILDPLTVDINGDPAPINIPAINEVTWMTVVPWNVGFDLTLGYEANRKRSEFLYFTLKADAQQVITDPLITENTEVLSLQTSNLSTPEIAFLNWDSVSGVHVALGTVVFPDDPAVPGQTSSQICTTAGTAGTVEPIFSNIAGQTTADGSVVWTSLGASPPADSAMDWNRFLNIARGTLIVPLPMVADNISSVLQPGVLTFPPHGVFINLYRLLTDGDSNPGDTIFECTTVGMLVPAGQAAPAPPPVFNNFTNPSGMVMYICTGAGQTGEFHTSFNEPQGATTTDGTVTWTSLGPVTLPIGGWPGMTPARSYFPSDRGQMSVQHLICRARAKLRKRARAMQLSWECPFQNAIGLSCRMNASISDSRIPGGVASGKVIAYKIIAQGNTGRLYGEVTIGCTVGNAGHIASVPGTPTYVEEGYVDTGFQLHDGQVVTFGAEDIGYTPPIEQAVDDGLVFPIDYNQVVLFDGFHGSQAEELAAVHEAIFLAQEAAYNSTSSSLTVAGGSSVSTSYTHPDYAAIQNTMRNANLVGAGLWYELTLKPLTNGPFAAAYSLQMTTLALPKTIDLAAPSGGGGGGGGGGGSGPSSVHLSAVGYLSAAATGGTAAAGLSPPAGYTSADLIFEDRFTSSSLNAANWNPWMGLNGIRWQGNADDLVFPYSAIGNLPGGNNVEYGNPYPYGYSTDNGAGIHLVQGGGGLEFIASPDTHEPDYTWAAAYVCGTRKLAIMPATGGYLQIRAQMPDSTHGGWGSLWMLAESPGTGNEMDLQETGFTTAGIPVNQQMASSIHTGPELFSNVGVDISAGFHIYGLEYIPGVSVKTYFDGALQQHWTTGVSTGAYEVIVSMTMWGGDPSVHTLSDPVSHPGPYTMTVSDVQIYKYPP